MGEHYPHPTSRMLSSTLTCNCASRVKHFLPALEASCQPTHTLCDIPLPNSVDHKKSLAVPHRRKKPPNFKTTYMSFKCSTFILRQQRSRRVYIYVHLYNQPSFLLPETLQPALQRRHKQRHGGHAPRERRGRAEVIAVLRIVHEVSEDLLFRGRRLAVGDLVRDLEAGRKRLRRERGEGSPGVEFTLWGLVSSNSRGRGGREYLSRTHWRVAASIHRSPR